MAVGQTMDPRPMSDEHPHEDKIEAIGEIPISCYVGSPMP